MLLHNPAVANLTILSIFKIILFEFDYRTVNVFITCTLKDESDIVLDMIMNTLKKHAIPTTVLNYNTIAMNRKRCEEPILNILIPMYTTMLDGMKNNIYPNDISFILDHSVIENNDTVIGSEIYDRMQVSNKVIIIKNLSMIALHPLRKNKMDIMPLSPFEQENAKNFIQSYIDSSMYLRQEKNLTIFFQYLTPRSMIAFTQKGFFYVGSDGPITSILLSLLNATGTFVSDVGLTYPGIVRSWNDRDKQQQNPEAYEYYQNAMTTNNITVYNQSITAAEVALHMSPYIVQPDFEDRALNLSTERLYPHERECVVVILPKQKQPDNFLTKVVRNGDMQSVGLAMFTLIIARIVIEKAPYRKWFAISYKSFGILFNQLVIRDDNFFESAWTNILKGFSTIATIALSAIIYNNLVNDQYREIDSIEELIASNLTAIAPDSLKTHLTLRLSESRPKLLKNIVFKDIETLGASLMALNFSFAYILKENPANNYLKIVKHSAKKGDSGRIMTENLYCDMLSYRINLKSHYKGFVEDFVLRIIENGFYRKHLEWATALLNGLFKVPTANTLVGFKSTLTVKMINGVFKLYQVGIGISCMVFLIENIYVKYKQRLK